MSGVDNVATADSPPDSAAYVVAQPATSGSARQGGSTLDGGSDAAEAMPLE